MKLPLAALLLAISNDCITTTNAIVSNPQESPQVLSEMTNVCSSAQGRTSKCEVELDVPAECVTGDGSSSCPIVFFFHGAGGTNNWFARTSNVHSKQVIGVYPQGEDGWNTGPKNSNNCSWDDFECTSDPDEGAFIASIITELRNLNANGNIYLIGNSNGAALSLRLASNAGDELPIKGVVAKVTQLLESPPRSGPGVLNHNQPAQDGPQVSILNIMGTADGVIPYEGGSSSVFGGNDSFELLSALDSMEVWASHNGCVVDGTVSTDNNEILYSTTDGSEGQATFYKYQGCPEGVLVEHIAIHGAGHSFGSGAALDGVTIDYDLAYQFIDRLEEDSGGGGGGSSPCEDDSTWHGKFNEAHTCGYVSENPSARCGWEDASGMSASVACMKACGECGGTNPDPTPVPTSSPVKSITPAPSSAPTFPQVPTAPCQDDPEWHGKFSVDHTCAYVNQNPTMRCGWEDASGVLASVACKVACGTC